MSDSRAQAILAAVRREVERRQALLDATTDLYSVMVVVKFESGTSRVRGVVWNEERLDASRRDRLRSTGG